MGVVSSYFSWADHWFRLQVFSYVCNVVVSVCLYGIYFQTKKRNQDEAAN